MRVISTKLCLLLIVSYCAIAVEYNVDRDAGNLVRFVAQAKTLIKTFEFDGETDQIDGYIYWEKSCFQNILDNLIK